MAIEIPRLPEMVRTDADRRAVAEGCYFDTDAANRIYTFFAAFLRHSKSTVAVSAGSPFTLLPWQWEDVIAPVFGWKRKDGTRRFREAYIEIPKKNGKSTFCSGCSLYLLMADGEPGAEVYSAAADRDQASIVYNEAVNMVRASPALTKRLWPVPSKKQLDYPKTRSFYRVLSREANTKEGFNIHGLIFDEFHAQLGSDLYDTLKYGGAARRQPLFIYITTAGYDRESVCFKKHQYAEAVLAQEHYDAEFFAYVKGAKETDDWQDPKVWAAVNPSYGVTINPDEMARSAKVAADTPSEENTFKRYRLNIWTQQNVRWLPQTLWDACERELPELLGEKCFAGLDLAATRDINSCVLWFPEHLCTLEYYWVPTGALKRRQRDKQTRLDDWVKAKFIVATEGDAAEYDAIESDVLKLAGKYDLQTLGVDIWNSLQMVEHLANEGIDIGRVGQGYASMSPALKMFETLVVRKKLGHGANPVTRWMFGNLAVKQDPAGNLKPDKSKCSEKIDGIVALLMALSAWMNSDGECGYAKNPVDFI